MSKLLPSCATKPDVSHAGAVLLEASRNNIMHEIRGFCDNNNNSWDFQTVGVSLESLHRRTYTSVEQEEVSDVSQRLMTGRHRRSR